jgi:hypothetical protein
VSLFIQMLSTAWLFFCWMVRKKVIVPPPSTFEGERRPPFTTAFRPRLGSTSPARAQGRPLRAGSLNALKRGKQQHGLTTPFSAVVAVGG